MLRGLWEAHHTSNNHQPPLRAYAPPVRLAGHIIAALEPVDTTLLCRAPAQKRTQLLEARIAAPLRLGMWDRLRSSRSTVVEFDVSLFSGLATDSHFTGVESGTQWEDDLLQLETAAAWKAVMSRGADERTRMNSMAILSRHL